ncbi:hypothetical protein H8959_004763, partial [Pygathrix nigripes]
MNGMQDMRPTDCTGISLPFYEQVKKQAQQCNISGAVIFRWWKISLRSEYRSTKPGEAKEIHEDFLENLHLQ